MKDKVLIFIIGMLVGAIIVMAGMFIYFNFFNNSDEGTMPEMQNEQMEQTQGREMGDPPEDIDSNDDEEPPEKPDGEDSTNGDGEEPPEISNDENNNENAE